MPAGVMEPSPRPWATATPASSRPSWRSAPKMPIRIRPCSGSGPPEPEKYPVDVRIQPVHPPPPGTNSEAAGRL